MLVRAVPSALQMESRSRTEIIAAIESLTAEARYVYALAFLLRVMLFYDPAEAADINWHSRLSYQELTFVAGLLVKHPILLTHPSEKAFWALARRTHQLFDELHEVHSEEIFDRIATSTSREKTPREPAEAQAAARAFFGSGAVMTESIFYAGSGAYDFQYWTLAPERYRLDEDWLLTSIGVTIEDVAHITKELKTLIGSDLESPPTTFDDFLDGTLDIFCVDAKDLVGVASKDALHAFLEQFSLDPGHANAALVEPGQFNELDARPLIRLPDGRFFLPVHFNLSRSIYESPFYWMLQDDAYAPEASRNRGDATEAIAERMLKGVFGDAVHRRVTRTRGSTQVGDIDVLATLGRKALIVQCKSKRLTELARRGDTERLESDFEAAVQSAYNQALRCRDLLRDPAVTVQTDGGERLEVEFDDAFICCIVSDHYPSLALQVHTYLAREDDEPWPLAISIFDLELLCHYLSNPFDFLYYVRQRTRLAERFRSDEEIGLLAYHLKQKLWVSPAVDMVALDSTWAQLIDANYPGAVGIHLPTEASDRLFHEWKNAHFDQLVDDLRNSDEPGFVDAVFLLYDFSGDAIDELFGEILSAKAQSRYDGRKHSIATASEEADAGISFVTRPTDSRLLEEHSLIYGQLKKYQTRATEWLGLGSLADSPRLADFVAYARGPWSFDSALEEDVKKLLGRGVARRLGGKIGRNEPCFCGSGLKFKRCHGR